MLAGMFALILAVIAWETVFVALFASVIGPTCLLLAAGWVHHNDKQDVYKREDELKEQARVERIADEERADRVEAAAEATRIQAERAAELLVANNELVQSTTADVSAQLTKIQDGNEVIHGLVNSNLQAVLEAKYETSKREMAGLRREMILTTQLRLPLTELKNQITALETDIAAQELVLTERKQQTASTAELSAATFPPDVD